MMRIFLKSFDSQDSKKCCKQTEGIEADLLILEEVTTLRQKIAEELRVVCLVTDLGDMSWGGVDGILQFAANHKIEAPLLITTGTDLYYITGQKEERELNDMGISILRKPYRLGALVARIKLLINAARSR